MKNTYYCVISVVSDQDMTLYKGEVDAAQKPEDMYFGDKNFSIDVEYFDKKKDRDNFYTYNNGAPELPRIPFKNKPYYYAMSLVANQSMTFFKGQIYAPKQPEEIFKGDSKLSLSIEYFEKKKDRDNFVYYNDVDVPERNDKSYNHNEISADTLDCAATSAEQPKSALADKINSASSRAEAALNSDKSMAKETTPER